MRLLQEVMIKFRTERLSLIFHVSQFLDEAGIFLNVASSLEQDAFLDIRRRGKRTLIDLSAKSGVVPSAIFLKRVEADPGAHAVAYGGFADIFSGFYDGQLVALKRVRVFLTTSNREELKRVSASNICSYVL
jgi:hypothetical protein